MKQSLEALVHCITYSAKQGALIDELVQEAMQADCDTPSQVVEFLLDIVTKIKICGTSLGMNSARRVFEPARLPATAMAITLCYGRRFLLAR
jgi:hypothetical protein